MNLHKKIFGLLAALSVFFLMFSSLAFAVDITYSADTTIALTAGNLTIVSGSVATTVVVNTNTLVVTTPTSSTFTLTSASVDLTGTGYSSQATYSHTCSSSTVTVVLTTSASSTEITTFTPSSNACSGTAGGSGGSGTAGGSGGGGGSTTTTTPAPAAPSATGSLSMSGGGVHANGTLIIDGKTVYLIKDGKKLGFRNPDEYKSHGYNFGQAVAANAQDKALPQAEFVQKALEGTLVLDASDGKTVYMIGINGSKRGFASADVFKALGYAFGSLPKINLSDYPSGLAITSASEPHPEGALVRQSNGTVWWILGSKKQGFESMAVFNTYGFPTSRLVKANATDLALLEGSLVKFRDGTLVKDGNDYYLISDGKKFMFASSADVAAKGYKTTNAISAGLAKYAGGGVVP